MKVIKRGDNYALERFYEAVPARVAGEMSRLMFSLADMNNPSVTAPLHDVRLMIEDWVREDS